MPHGPFDHDQESCDITTLAQHEKKPLLIEYITFAEQAMKEIIAVFMGQYAQNNHPWTTLEVQHDIYFYLSARAGP